MSTPARTHTRTEGTDFIVTRTFDAPRERVFAAWTDPKRLARWWGPGEFTCPVCEMDPRPGGAFRIVMRSPEGVDYPLNGVVTEIVPPERLVMTCDTAEHPPEWHDELNALRGAPKGTPTPSVTFVVTFETDGAGTRLTVRNRFPTAADRDAHVEMGMGEGWGGLMDKLAALLAKG